MDEMMEVHMTPNSIPDLNFQFGLGYVSSCVVWGDVRYNITDYTKHKNCKCYDPVSPRDVHV